MKIQPEHYQAWFNQGIALGKLGCHQAALMSFNKFLQFYPNDYWAWYNRAIALGQIGRDQETSESYSRAVAVQQDSKGYGD